MNKKSRPESIYHNLIKNNRVLIGFNIITLIFCFMLIKNENTMPLVIRYMPNGQIETIENYHETSKINAYDTDIFLTEFVNRWNLDDSFAIQDNIPKALNLMDKELRQKMASYITKGRVEEVVEKNQKTITTIEKIKFKTSGDFIDAKVRYRRQIISFKNKPLKTSVRRMELILSVLERRSKQHPHGLLVTQFEEFNLN